MSAGPPLARLVSIQVGRPTVHGTPDAVDPLDRPWRTGFFKAPVAGPEAAALLKVPALSDAWRQTLTPP